MNRQVLDAIQGWKDDTSQRKLRNITDTTTATHAKQDTDHPSVLLPPDADVITASEYEMKDYYFQSGIDGWIEHCPSEVTIPTEVLSFQNRDEVCALLASSTYFVPSEYYKTAKCRDEEQQHRPNEKQTKLLLQTIEQRLEECIMNHGWNRTGCFVKLTTRSPKDSMIAKEAASRHFIELRKKDEFGPCNESFNSIKDHSKRWMTYGELRRQALRVTSGKQALDVLLSSQRIYEDLKWVLEEEDDTTAGASGNTHHTINWWKKVGIAMREWDDHCQPHREFRAFVWDHQLTCIGQSFYMVRFDSLQDDPAILKCIEQDTKEIWNKIKDSILVPCYMMDLALLGNGSDNKDDDDDHNDKFVGRNYLIEINPFGGGDFGTSQGATGLFDWYRDRDVMTGRIPKEHIEVRVQTKPLLSCELQRSRPTLDKDWWNAIYGPIH